MKTAVIIMVLVLLYLGMNIECQKTNYDINRLKAKKEELLNYGKVLQIEVAKLRSLERIEGIARKDLNLVTPDKYETITLLEDKEKGSFWNKVKSFFSGIFSAILKLF